MPGGDAGEHRPRRLPGYFAHRGRVRPGHAPQQADQGRGGGAGGHGPGGDFVRAGRGRGAAADGGRAALPLSGGGPRSHRAGPGAGPPQAALRRGPGAELPKGAAAGGPGRGRDGLPACRAAPVPGSAGPGEKRRVPAVSESELRSAVGSGGEALHLLSAGAPALRTGGAAPGHGPVGRDGVRRVQAGGG